MLGEVLTAVVTPFRSDGEVDLDAFRRLCRFLVENGSDGLVVTGTTGEASTLTDDERFALYEVAIDEVGDEHAVIVGTGSNDTAHSVHVTRRAHDLGVDGFLIVTPYYNKPPQRGIVAHVAAVAAVTDRPIVFYDIPGRTVIEAEPATITALAEIPTVRGVKQAKPSLDAARHVVASGLDLYAGDDDLILPFLEVGGTGGICVHTHVVGPQVREMVSRFRAGDVDGARALDEGLRPAIDLLRSRAIRSRSRPRSTCSATRSAASACRSSMRHPRKRQPCATASSASVCCKPPRRRSPAIPARP